MRRLSAARWFGLCPLLKTALERSLDRFFEVVQSQLALSSARPTLDVRVFIKSGCRTADSRDCEQKCPRSRRAKSGPAVRRHGPGSQSGPSDCGFVVLNVAGSSAAGPEIEIADWQAKANH